MENLSLGPLATWYKLDRGKKIYQHLANIALLHKTQIIKSRRPRQLPPRKTGANMPL